MKRAFIVFVVALACCFLFVSTQASALDPSKISPQQMKQPKFVPPGTPIVKPLVQGNPFVDVEGAYSASISMMPGKAVINWWGRLNGDVKFENLSTFYAKQATAPEELEVALGGDFTKIADDRILPWYESRKFNPAYGLPNQPKFIVNKVPIITHCQVMKNLKTLAPLIGPTIMCTQDAPVVLAVDATAADVIQQLKAKFKTTTAPYLFYFEDALQQKSPPLVFEGLIANGLAQVDTDGDGIYDAFDNCASVPNPDQKDTNDDGSGDACIDFSYDPPPPPADSDNDSLPDDVDKCPEMDNYTNNADSDGDGVGDMCDACPDDPGVLEEDGCPRKSLDITGDGGVASSGESDVTVGGMDGGACSFMQPAINSYMPFILVLLGFVPGMLRRRRK